MSANKKEKKQSFSPSLKVLDRVEKKDPVFRKTILDEETGNYLYITEKTWSVFTQFCVRLSEDNPFSKKEVIQWSLLFKENKWTTKRQIYRKIIQMLTLLDVEITDSRLKAFKGSPKFTGSGDF